MGCIAKYYINEDTVIGVWRIEETIRAMARMVYLDDFDKKKYRSFKSISRRLEFLSVRVLLAELLGKDARIVYNKYNKPFLKDGSGFISITHSHNLTAIIYSKTERVGIDLEIMKTNIGSMSFKFINKREVITKNNLFRKYHLYIHWCAKEALYKICDKEGISIKNSITIEPFEVKASGTITGSVVTKKLDESFELYYCKFDNYTLVWTKKRHYDKLPA